MTQRNDEDLLREAFQELRRDESRRAAAPDFEAMMSRARAEVAVDVQEDAGAKDARGIDPIGRTAGRPRPGLFARPEAWLSLAAAAAVATLLLAGPSPADREFERLVTTYSSDAAAGAWRSPTDALLSTPGLDLGTVPSFGTSIRGLGSLRDDTDLDDAGRDS